jgi:glycolate oxidase
MITPALASALERVVGAPALRLDPTSLDTYGADALKQIYRPDIVVLPGSAREIAEIVVLCREHRVPIVPRGGGTGYTGGSVPTRGGVVLALDRLNRILEIDEDNLLAVVEPNVVTADLQRAVEARGLFYPPDPASLHQSVIGGNVAECAGGPRAFKYGTTKRYVLGLEAVLPTGEIVRTGGKTVKNVVGYDLTQLLVGSEGTLAILTEIILRLVPKPAVQATLRATFASIREAVDAVGNIVRARVVPAAIELVDRDSLEALAAFTRDAALAAPGTNALLLIEVDGSMAAVAEEADAVERACRTSGARTVLRARDESERQELWQVRRDLSPSLKTLARLKLNHDIVVPKGRIPALFDLVERLRGEHRIRIACFGHVGDGNIHVNLMLDPDNADEVARGRVAERRLFEGVIALEGSISGEHGIGYAKASYLPLELSRAEIALMKRVKQAFDPDDILNPGKIFPD